MKKQQGFTLIELVMIIVVIGILAATAIPKFANLSGQANQAAVNGVAGALSSASIINYATESADPLVGIPVGSCADATLLLLGDALPGTMQVNAAPAALNATPTPTTCTVELIADTTINATFTTIEVL